MKISQRVFDTVCVVFAFGWVVALIAAILLSFLNQPVAPELWGIAGGVRFLQFLLQLRPHQGDSSDS